MFSYFMGNFFHNLKHILESQLYLDTGIDYLIFLSIADWKKWLLISHEILSFGATEECHVIKNDSTAMILTYCLLIGWQDFSFLLALLCTQLISGGCQFQAKNNHHLAWFSSAVCYYPCKHVIYKSFFTLEKEGNKNQYSIGEYW